MKYETFSKINKLLFEQFCNDQKHNNGVVLNTIKYYEKYPEIKNYSKNELKPF